MHRYTEAAFFISLAVVWGSACTPPPSVQAVDGWLSAYAQGDVERMLAHTTPDDRNLLREAMSPTTTSSLALILPPRPLSHELLEIEKKSSDGSRHIVLCRVKMKNPLAFMSEKVGQQLEIPRARTRRRRFLSVEGADGRWGVKLDLAQVLARARFVQRFEQRLRARRFDDAQRMLSQIPRPPDEANVQRTKDRLEERLRAKLKTAQASSHRGTKTSTLTVP
ncbi:MAG: hypothetical protein AAF449_20505 [Myxococcota bacterium]